MSTHSSDGILKNDPIKVGLFPGKVTISYLKLLLIRAFLKLLSHGFCYDSIGSENCGNIGGSSLR